MAFWYVDISFLLKFCHIPFKGNKMSRQDIILNAWVCAKLHSSLNHRPLGTFCPLELAWFPWITTFCTHYIRSKFWGSPELISYPLSSLKTRECHGDGQTADLPPHRCHLFRILPRSLLTRQLWALEKSEHRAEVTTPKAWNLPSYSAWLLVLFSAHSAHLLPVPMILLFLSLNDLCLSET